MVAIYLCLRLRKRGFMALWRSPRTRTTAGVVLLPRQVTAIGRYRSIYNCRRAQRLREQTRDSCVARRRDRLVGKPPVVKTRLIIDKDLHYIPFSLHFVSHRDGFL